MTAPEIQSESLESEVQTVAAYMRAHRNFEAFTKIHSLPDEVLSHIFGAICEFWTSRRVHPEPLVLSLHDHSASLHSETT